MPKESKRQRDLNGYMTVRDNPISKVGVFDYLGSEIAGHDLPPNEVFKVYRPAEELADEDTIASFRLMPFIDEHEVLGDNATAPERKGIQGYIGEQVRFESPYLLGNIMIPSRAAQIAIDAGKIELSPAYRCVYEKKDGVFEGQPYQFIQRQIRANHLALVTEGRTGPDVAVLDHRTFTLDTARLSPMFTPEQLEQIKMLIAEAIAASAVVDADPEEKPAVDADPAKDEEAVKVEEEVKDEEPAKDADPKADEDKPAMDALRAELAEVRKLVAKPVTADAMVGMIADRDALASKVSQFIGAFDHSRMTCDGVAKYACEKVGLKAAAGSERLAIDAWLHGRKPESARVIAQDSRATGDTIDALWSKK